METYCFIDFSVDEEVDGKKILRYLRQQGVKVGVQDKETLTRILGYNKKEIWWNYRNEKRFTFSPIFYYKKVTESEFKAISLKQQQKFKIH